MEQLLKMVLCLSLFVLTAFFYENNLFHKVNFGALKVYKYDTLISRNDSVYIIDTPGCKIPNYEAFDLSIREKILPGRFTNCDKTRSFLKISSNCLEIDHADVQKSQFKNSFSFCRVHRIYRPRQGQHHNFFRYIPIKGRLMTGDQLCLESDMARVKCFDRKNRTIFTELYWIYQRNDSYEELCDKRLRKRMDDPKITENLNVLLLGVDSTSRLNSQRYFLKTRQILEREFNSFEFKGHNIVGMTTFQNVVPVLTGKSIYELKEDGKFGNTTMDNFQFIWKDFEENGYRTLFAEDAAHMATFDYFKPGFQNYPAQFYNRPWSVAWWYAGSPRCMGGRSEPEAVMEYLTKFVDVYKSKPYFAFVFLSSLTHDRQELSAEMDEVMSKFFTKAYESNAFNNTMVFFFSDHGFRIGRTRWSNIGMYEVLSPMLFITVPKWFSDKYKKIDKNLRNNANKLTTVYDIHETLRDILNFNGRVEEHSSILRGESLFSDVSKTRNCTDVGVPESLCSCSHYINVKNFSTLYATRNLSTDIVSKLNDLLKNHQSVCERISLDKTISVYQEVSGRKHTYRISIRTLPGKALFEASVSSINDKYHVGQILRINKYGDQSKCLNDYFLRNYCYCKDT
ncbi:uncharacterized protein LOC133173301 [Saccostrea echinata]|uniref:uncharacterized protein LOC133173301 n=1 Tax=Saccostrea echinata TaxID=191078 RepID=UPI002A82C104|nr:uncharacterized protein LOC133173301 [Saccostrea echinata]